ncbi:MAG: hypothetical protein ILO68_01600 [Clostridia bacterium]|nr:hypothetical protein [Clostridia bacterium]
MAGYQKIDVLIREELDELAEEGRAFDRQSLEREIEACAGDAGKLSALYDRMMELPYRSDWPYVEPSDWEGVR